LLSQEARIWQRECINPGTMTREGYGQAYQRGFDITFRFLQSRGVPRDSAREASQAAWAKGWERLSQLRDEQLVVTWVNTIALNAYRGVRRREGSWSVLPDLSTRPAINLAAIDMARILRICSASDRVLLEQQMKGHTPGEIARMRGVPEGAIRVRLLRARRAARLRLEQSRCTALSPVPPSAE
jgi:DNA-directed RNA polymerase specialized sigma24 family protein